ncbi:MAG: 3,4-dihydroxy-2-butanone-4-phosphate synthase, partial [Mangrovicoccus sp.]
MAKDFTETQALSAALSALTLGEVVIVTGAQDGPFMLAAGEKITPGAVNLMATHARGLVEIALSPARAEELCLAPQPRRSWSARAEYAVSIEAAKGTSTGISATDRARTIQAASCGGPEDIVTPGHIIPRVCTPSEAGARQEAGTIALELLTKAGLS